MTTFEITIIVLVVIIAIAVIYGVLILKQTISYNQMVTDANLRKIDAGLDERLDNLTNIVESKLVAIVNYTYETRLSAREVHDIVDKMHRNLCVEIADKMVDRMYKQPTSVNGTPCYAPDGICTNPFRDCINCHKRGGGGTWSTNINKND